MDESIDSVREIPCGSGRTLCLFFKTTQLVRTQFRYTLTGFKIKSQSFDPEFSATVLICTLEKIRGPSTPESRW